MAVEIPNVVHAMAVIELADPPRFINQAEFMSAVRTEEGAFVLRLRQPLKFNADEAEGLIVVTSLSSPGPLYVATLIAGGDEVGNVNIQVTGVDGDPVDGNFAQVVVLRFPSNG
jgi:hypothetical protein